MGYCESDVQSKIYIIKYINKNATNELKKCWKKK